MARIRICVLLCIFGLSLLVAALASAPAQAAPVSSDTPGSNHSFLPMVMHPFSDTAAGTLPSLADFAASLTAPSSTGIQGLYAPAAFAYHVVAQPAGNYAYISSAADTVTEFGLADAGVVGLLGHVTLAGKNFPALQIHQFIYLVWADGSTRRFTITGAYRFRAVTPRSPSSDFIALDSGTQISAADLFVQFYTGSQHVTLQTCIAQDGDSNWGRLFVVAVPAE